MEPIPKPIQKKMWWPFPLVWIVPLGAAVLAGYFFYQRHQQQGITITIQFADAQGIKEGETALAVRGVNVGKVNTVELSPDHQHTLVHVKLSIANSFLARKETLFWLVKPEVSLESIKGLDTLVTGPYITAQPGDGAQTTNFVAVDGPPVIDTPGIKLVLHADQVGQLVVDSPVFYRGIQVGIVQDIRLSSDSTDANVTIYVWDYYKNLIRTHSQFWIVKGADIRGGLLSGIKVELNSLRALIGGGISFATPEEDYGQLIKPMTTFDLHAEAQDDWLAWKPKIILPPDADPTVTTGGTRGGLKLFSGLKHE